MSKFNTGTTRSAVFSPVQSEALPSGRTFEGGPGHARSTQSELFLLAVTNMVGERTFYEEGGKRDERFASLGRAATIQDADWTARFLRWLRSEANMRTASIVGAAEFVAARREAGLPGMDRQVVDSVLQRADEPGEFLAYWMSTYGRTIPTSVKKGISDAIWRLYNERSFLKWDSDARGLRFADVISLVHPTGSLKDTKSKPIADTWRGVLYEHILDDRHGNADAHPTGLATLRARARLMSLSPSARRSRIKEPMADEVLRDAGMTWESVAGWLQGPMDAYAWQAVIPSMGLMALTRNLRNFDEAGVPDAIAKQVAERLADPAEVVKSRQLPMRFLSAYRAAPSLRWAWALEQAITHSLANVPALGGRTLILVDTSSSMNDGFSKDGTLKRWDAAAVFGVALGSRCADAEVVSFSSAQYYHHDPAGAKTKAFPLRAGESLLKSVERWKSDGYFLGGGTDTPGALRKHFAGHDRVVILTDEQAGHGGVDDAIPASVPLYTWNLAGYQHGHAPSGSRNRHTFGGLSDRAFTMLPLLEAGQSASWPF